MSAVLATLQQAQALILKREWAKALPMLQRVMGKAGPQGDILLAYCLVRTGKAEQAVFFAERAARSAPNDAGVRRDVAGIYADARKPELALAEYRAAWKLDATSNVPAVCISGILHGLGRRTEALEVTRQGLEQFPRDPDITAHAAICLQDLGRYDEAFRLLRAAREAHPTDMRLRSVTCQASCYDSELSPEAIFEEHVSFGRTLESQHTPGAVPYQGSKDPDRRLRVGFVSFDMRSHSVAFFFEPLLEHLDRTRVAPVVFSTCESEDAVTQRLKALRCEWHAVPGLSPIELAQRILAAGIDVLVDLSGHTGANSLVAMHLRPAPVQATYLGYPNTTGVTGIRYRLIDELTDPPEADRFATEKLLRLGVPFLCYRPPEDAPAVAPLPEGAPVFGSFNNIHKLSPTTISLWSRLLAAVPDAKLMLKSKGIGDAEIDRSIRDRFQAAGTDASRLVLSPPVRGLAPHLAEYGKVWVGLDTTPYAGTTTTCEALWMGVPVVTLAGTVHSARVGVSLLTSVGHPDLVAGTTDAYIEKAVALISDRTRLASRRASLRSSMQASALCDAPGLARRFEGALRAMWQDYCRTP